MWSLKRTDVGTQGTFLNNPDSTHTQAFLGGTGGHGSSEGPDHPGRCSIQKG